MNSLNNIFEILQNHIKENMLVLAYMTNQYVVFINRAGDLENNLCITKYNLDTREWYTEYTESDNQNDFFAKHLEYASNIVQTWPIWKQEILGCSVNKTPREKLQETLEKAKKEYESLPDWMKKVYDFDKIFK